VNALDLPQEDQDTSKKLMTELAERDRVER